MTEKMDDVLLVQAALRIAGGYHALERETGVTRQSPWRLLTGKQKRLQVGTRQKLRKYIRGE